MSALIWQVAADASVVALLYALVGLSFGLIYVAAGVMHMAHGATFLVSGYTLYAVHGLADAPLGVAAVAAVAAAAATGWAWSVALYEPLARRGTAPQVVLIASLGAFAVVQNMLVMVFGSDTQTVSKAAVVQGLPLGPVVMTPLQLATAALCVVCLVLVLGVIRWTELGKHMRAIADDPELAQVLGVRVRRTRRLVFALGSALVAVCAVLGGLDVGVSPSSGLRVVLVAAAATILGGTRALAGGVAGGVLVGALETSGSMVLDARWQNVIVFFAMLLGLVWRPQGLFRRAA